MGKVQEEFERLFDVPDYLEFDGEAYMYYGSDPVLEEQWQNTHARFIGFSKGYKAADLLPTTKVCPECGGSGKIKGHCSCNGMISNSCQYCNGDWERVMFHCQKCTDGIIQLYYTPEDYLRIMGVPYPDDCLVWVQNDYGYQYAGTWRNYKCKDKIYYIVQTAQRCPEADYRREG